MAAVNIAEASAGRQVDVIEALVSTLIAHGVASLPDLLEPATSPNHRQLFHSWLALGGATYLLRCLHRWQPEEPFERIVRTVGKAACVAYVAHLALDALTPRSLPMVGRI